MGTAKIRVLVADDHELFRAGLRRLIEVTGDIEVVAEAGSGDGAAVEAEAAQPDVILLDIAMPRMSGIEAIEAIARVSPRSRILMLTMFDEVSQLRAALAAGACGYLVKTRSEQELISAIRAVHAGRSYIDVSVPDSSLEALVRQEPPGRAGEPQLSQRERQVLALIAEGHTYREIAARLGVGIKSVETYRERLGDKLGLDSKAELVRYALENDLDGRRGAPDR